MPASNPRRVFVVVPAYNEGQRLLRVIDDLAPTRYAVVIVDDGSRDDTAAVAATRHCYVLRHAINRGQGAALQTGISFALREGAEIVVTFDADGQHLVSDLPAMLAPLLEGRADVTLGNRFTSGSSNVPPFRALVLHAARVITFLTSGLRVGDTHNGYRAFTRRAALTIHLRQDRMAHASEIYDQIQRSGFACEEVPVTIRYSDETLAKGQRLSNSVSVLFHYIFGKFTS